MANELEINIGDAWKEADSIKINIGDAWKDVKSMQINVGDVWKVAWKKKAAYFKVRFRAKCTDAENLVIGVRVVSEIVTQIALQGTWTNHVTSALIIGATSYREDELADLLVRCCTIDSGETYSISEIEVDIYDDNDTLLDTVKPNSDNSPLDWSSTGASHYTEVDQGVETPDDAKYIYTSGTYDDEYLGLENPSW